MWDSVALTGGFGLALPNRRAKGLARHVAVDSPREPPRRLGRLVAWAGTPPFFTATDLSHTKKCGIGRRVRLPYSPRCGDFSVRGGKPCLWAFHPARPSPNRALGEKPEEKRKRKKLLILF